MKRRLTFVSILFLAVLIAGDSITSVMKAQDMPEAAHSESRCTHLRLGPKPRKVIRKKMKPKAIPSVSGYAQPGTRCMRLAAGGKKGAILPNKPPNVWLSSWIPYTRLDGTPVRIDPTGVVFIGGPRGGIDVMAVADDPDGDTMLYTWSPTVGTVSSVGGDGGPYVLWGLSSAPKGSHTITVEVDDGCGCVASYSAKVLVQ